jgi:hypothetical protein
VGGGGVCSIPTAVSGWEMTWPAPVGDYACLSFGHSAWLTPS